MNEHVRPEFGLLVAAERSEARHLGTNHFVGLPALEQAIGAAIGMSWSAKQRMGDWRASVSSRSTAAFTPGRSSCSAAQAFPSSDEPYSFASVRNE